MNSKLSSDGSDRNGTKEAASQKDTDPSTSEPTSKHTKSATASKTTSTFEYRASEPSNSAPSIDSEIDQMLAAVQNDIRIIQAEEFPTRKRTKHLRSERAVPFPYHGLKKIMKTEEFIVTELERRSSCEAQSNSASKNEMCTADSGCRGKHPPKPFNFKAECGLLMGKASELLVKELAIRSYYESAEQGKIVIQRSHIRDAIATSDTFDFLIDIVPSKSIMADSVAAEGERGTDDSSNEVNNVPTRKNASGSQKIEAQPPRQGRTITVAQAAAQLEMLKNIVQQQQQQQQGQENNNNSFSFSL